MVHLLEHCWRVFGSLLAEFFRYQKHHFTLLTVLLFIRKFVAEIKIMETMTISPCLSPPRGRDQTERSGRLMNKEEGFDFPGYSVIRWAGLVLVLHVRQMVGTREHLGLSWTGAMECLGTLGGRAGRGGLNNHRVLRQIQVKTYRCRTSFAV